jgi:hypothetical protein
MEVGPRVRDSNRRWRPFEAAPVMTTVRVVAAVVASLLACGPAAVAGPPTAEEEAAVLFEHAKALMDASRYAEACPTFERSETLDPQVGTMLNLAFCDENLGKTATAWTVWVEAAAKADERGQTSRAEFARSRASLLEPRLLRITVLVAPQRDLDQLDVRVDGVSLARSRWGTPIPIDPGSHWLQASAAGRRPYWRSFEVDEQSVPPVTVPSLDDPPGPAQKADGDRDGSPRAWRRPAALVMGTFAAVALGAGGVLAGVSKATYDSSSGYCGALVCDEPGNQRRSTAKTEGNVASVAAASGAAAAIGAAILWFTARSNPPGLRIQATMSPHDLALSLQDDW